MFCSWDLDLDPMTLICENNLDILNTCLHTKMTFPVQVSRPSIVRASQTDTVTDTQTDATENITKPHSLRVSGNNASTCIYGPGSRHAVSQATLIRFNNKIFKLCLTKLLMVHDKKNTS